MRRRVVFVKKIVLVLDSVRSKENVGALFRTADAVAVEEVMLCGITPQPVNRFGNQDSKIKKAALGAENTIPWKYCADVDRACSNLRERGYVVCCLEQTQQSVSYTRLSQVREERIALVVGNEVDGVQSSLCLNADMCVFIPMLGEKESLNVTTATGIALYELRRSEV